MTLRIRLRFRVATAVIGPVLAAATLFSACGNVPSPDSSKPPAATPPSEQAEFLLTSAAADFRAQRDPRPARFRNVRSGHLVTDGVTQYRMCGEFLPEGAEEKGGWVPFATIRTSSYEQWLGGQALSFCKDPAMKWEDGDLSAVLLERWKQTR